VIDIIDINNGLIFGNTKNSIFVFILLPKLPCLAWHGCFYL